MKFESHKAIYLQIEDYIAEKILNNAWKSHDRIPSIRELAIALEVNPNTVARTYAELEVKHIITKQRGIGYFIAEQAMQKILELKRQEFLIQDLPRIFKAMRLLNINISDINQHYQEHTHENEN